jgi:chromosome segregation ATPase
LQSTTTQLEALRRSHEQLQQSSQKDQQQLVACQQQIEQLKDDKDKQSNMIASLREQLANVEQQRLATLTRATIAENASSEHQTSLITIQREHESLLDQHRLECDAHIMTKAKVEQLSEAHSNAVTQITNMEQSLAINRTAHDDMVSKVDDHQQSITQLEGTITKLRGLKMEAEQSLTKVVADTSTIIKDSQQREKQLATERESQRHALKTMELELKVAREMHHGCDARISSLESLLLAANDTIRVGKEETAKLQQTLLDTHTQLECMTSQYNTEVSNREVTESSLKAARQLADDRINATTSATERADRQLRTIADLRDTLRLSQQSHADLKSALAAVQTAHEHCASSIAAAQERATGGGRLQIEQMSSVRTELAEWKVILCRFHRIIHTFVRVVLSKIA